MSGSCESHPQPPSRDAYPTLCGKSQSEKTLKLLDDHWRPLKAKIAGNPVVLSRGERLDIFSPKKSRTGAANEFTAAEIRAINASDVFAVVSRKEGSYDIVGRGHDGLTLWHVRCIDDKWEQQEAIAKPVDPALQILDSLVLVSPDPDRVDLFAVMDGDMQLYTSTRIGDRGDFVRWLPLGGTVLGWPGVTSWAPNRIDLSIRGGDQKVYHKTNVNDKWMPSITGYEVIGSPITVAGTILSQPVGSPSEISDRPGRLILYSIGLGVNHDHRPIYTKAWEGHWIPNQEGSWEALGGDSGDAVISVVSGQRDRRDIAIRDFSGTVWHKYFDGQRHLPSELDWWRYGGNLAGPPVLSPAGSNKLEIFGQGIDGSLMYWREVLE